jgi:hypothetical protein
MTSRYLHAMPRRVVLMGQHVMNCSFLYNHLSYFRSQREHRSQAESSRAQINGMSIIKYCLLF